MSSLLSAVFLLATSAVASPITTRQAQRVCRDSIPQLTSWDFKDFYYHADYIFSTPAHQNSWGYLTFEVVNPVLASLGEAPLSCSLQSSRLSDFFFGTDSYTCEGDDVSAVVTYDRASGNLTFSETWTCYDQPQWPARYTATGQTTVNTTCTDTGNKVNEDWQVGEIYSERHIDCEKLDFPVTISEISAVA